jgi:hypothetical protein
VTDIVPGRQAERQGDAKLPVSKAVVPVLKIRIEDLHAYQTAKKQEASPG